MTVRDSLRVAAQSPKVRGVGWGTVFFALAELARLIANLLEKQ